MTRVCCHLFPSRHFFRLQGSGSLENIFLTKSQNAPENAPQDETKDTSRDCVIRLIALGLEIAFEAQPQEDKPILSIVSDDNKKVQWIKEHAFPDYDKLSKDHRKKIWLFFKCRFQTEF